MGKLRDPSETIKDAFDKGNINLPDNGKLPNNPFPTFRPPQHVCGGTGGKLDFREISLRESTIQKVTGTSSIDKIKGYKNGNTVYAEVSQLGLSASAEVMYGIGKEPLTADISSWQSFDKEKKVTMPHNILMWNRPTESDKPVYITFHIIEEGGKIGPPTCIKVDKQNSQGPGGDIELAKYRMTDIGMKLSGPRFHSSQIAPRAISEIIQSNDKIPIITSEKQFGIFSAYVEFESRDDAASNYVYSIGTAKGKSDLISSKSLMPDDRKTGWHSFAELAAGAAENGKAFKITDQFYINVWAYYADDPTAPGGYSYGNKSSSTAMQFSWEDLGTVKNIVKKINYVFPGDGYDSDKRFIEGGGWSDSEKMELRDFCRKMNDIIVEVYGAPAHNMDLRIIKNDWYQASAIFFAGHNEIHMNNIDTIWQLLTHEIIHAFHGHVHFEHNSLWRHDNRLMGFEEGFAQAVSYICMNEYARKYPSDPKGGNGYTYWQPSTLADYDFKNHDHLTTEDFWSSGKSNPMNIAFERYEMAASVFFKIYMENHSFFKNFNAKYYKYLNGNQDKIPTKELICKIIATTVGFVEGMPIMDWINNQRILDCKYNVGDKVRLNSNVLVYFNEFAHVNGVYHYQTFPNGSDYEDREVGELHSYNGRRGVYNIWNVADDSLVASGSFQPTPSENPPEVNEFALSYLNLSTTNADSSSIQENMKEGDHVRMIPITEDLALYKISLQYDQGSMGQVDFYRIAGTKLINADKLICGAFYNVNAETVTLTHEAFPDDPVEATVIDNIWTAEVPWNFGIVSGYNTGKKFPMGKVQIVYKDSSSGKYYSAYRNLGFGEINRGVNFIFIYNDKVKEIAGPIA